MKQKDENRWVEDVLNSMDGAAKARPAEDLYGKIEHRIAVPFTKGRTISLTTFSAAAASIVLLIVLNMMALTGNSRKHDNGRPDEVSSVARYYDITNESEGLGL